MKQHREADPRSCSPDRADDEAASQCMLAVLRDEDTVLSIIQGYLYCNCE